MRGLLLTPHEEKARITPNCHAWPVAEIRTVLLHYYYIITTYLLSCLSLPATWRRLCLPIPKKPSLDASGKPRAVLRNTLIGSHAIEASAATNSPPLIAISTRPYATLRDPTRPIPDRIPDPSDARLGITRHLSPLFGLAWHGRANLGQIGRPTSQCCSLIAMALGTQLAALRRALATQFRAYIPHTTTSVLCGSCASLIKRPITVRSPPSNQISTSRPRLFIPFPRVACLMLSSSLVSIGQTASCQSVPCRAAFAVAGRHQLEKMTRFRLRTTPNLVFGRQLVFTYLVGHPEALPAQCMASQASRRDRRPRIPNV
jgi:hypothetical protein